MHRGYPGVPVSSSRNDLETSPSSRGRKHPRQSSGSDPDGQNGSSRRKLNDEEEEDDERFGDGNSFRQNGMGNGGVYSGGINSYYGNEAESSTYTPHLLPIFQQPPAYNQEYQQDDPNNLEDASVLLSMAYGSATGQEQQPPAPHPQPVNQWDAPNLNMMMDTTKTNREETAGTSALNDATGNFLAAMNWLGAGKTGLTPNEGADTWASSHSSKCLKLTDSPMQTATRLPKVFHPFHRSFRHQRSTLPRYRTSRQITATRIVTTVT